MRRVMMGWGVGALLLAAAGCAGSNSPSASTSSSSSPGPVNISAGRQLYQKVCAYCHGQQGQGGVRMGAPQLWGSGNAISGSAYDSQKALAGFIQSNMPPITVNGVAPGSLSATDANNVAAYILAKIK